MGAAACDKVSFGLQLGKPECFADYISALFSIADALT
jgi:hypothetical protein